MDMRFRKTVVRDWQWGLLYKRGKFQRILEPGAYWWLTRFHEVLFLEKRRQIEIVSGQEVLTKDMLGVKLSLVIEYRIVEPLLAINEVEDVTAHLHSVAQIAIRKTVGERDLDVLLNEREAVAEEILAAQGRRGEPGAGPWRDSRLAASRQRRAHGQGEPGPFAAQDDPVDDRNGGRTAHLRDRYAADGGGALSGARERRWSA
jgi:hypothetical protein